MPSAELFFGIRHRSAMVFCCFKGLIFIGFHIGRRIIYERWSFDGENDCYFVNKIVEFARDLEYELQCERQKNYLHLFNYNVCSGKVQQFASIFAVEL